MSSEDKMKKESRIERTPIRGGGVGQGEGQTRKHMRN